MLVGWKMRKVNAVYLNLLTYSCFEGGKVDAIICEYIINGELCDNKISSKMKKVISILVLSFPLMYGLLKCGQMKAAEKDEEKISVEIQTVKGKNDYERDLNDRIQVYYYCISNFLEVTCYGESDVICYMFNSRNQLCGYAEFDSSVTSFGRIDVPEESGAYHIVIITSRSYYEGSFVK